MITNIILMDILPLSLIGLILFRIKLVKPLNSVNCDYLSIETSKCYRGIFAIVVLFYHLTQMTDAGFLFRLFEKSGYLAVSVFFFLSGFGLQKSYILKGEDYKNGFLLKRIPSILIPYIITIIIYWLSYSITGHAYSIKEVFISLINGNPIVTYSWYIINILLFYVVYWILMLVCKKHYLLMIIGGLIWTIVYIFICKKMGYDEFWFNASHLLVFGMFWATYEKKILAFIKKTYYIFTPVIWGSFILFFIKKTDFATSLSIPLLPFTMLTALLFVLSVVMLVLKVQIGNKPLNHLGNISLEIYLMQGLFITVLPIYAIRNKFSFSGIDFLWCLVVIICTIIFSFLLHLVFKKILKKYFSFRMPSAF